jgi:hypothetical protein
MTDIDDISYAWHRVTLDRPAIGERALIWHPAYGVMLAYRERTRERDGFYEAHDGELRIIDFPITWWMREPGRPAGEVDPADYARVSPVKQFSQIGFAGHSTSTTGEEVAEQTDKLTVQEWAKKTGLRTSDRVPHDQFIMMVNNSEGESEITRLFFGPNKPNTES